MKAKIKQLAIDLGLILKKRNIRCVVAESCTGGGLGYAITEVPGSSSWFERGFITYSNASKTQLLQVSDAIIEKYGAVSKECAVAMAQGAIANSNASVSIAITGIAGPEGGGENKPVGTVWIAWAGDKQALSATRYLFKGDRKKIREQAIEVALQGLINRSQEEAHPLLIKSVTDRYFFALWPDKDSALALWNQVQQMDMNPSGKFKLVLKENYHITLAYLGCTYPELLTHAQQLAGELKVNDFDLTLSNVHYWKHNKVAWCGIQRTPFHLLNLLEKLRFKLIVAGFAPESRSFTPHITLARGVNQIEAPLFNPIHWHVDKFYLVKSSGASFYEIINHWNLANFKKKGVTNDG